MSKKVFRMKVPGMNLSRSAGPGRRPALRLRSGFFQRLADLAREVGAVAQVAAAAHHRQVDAGAAALHHHGDDVDVGVARGFHALGVQHLRQRLDLVAHRCRLLELQVLGVGQHLRVQVFQHLGLAPAQEFGGVVDVAPVVLGRDQVHAGPAAAADLVQQAGTRAVVEDAVLAGAQLEHLLQQLHRFLDRPGARERTEVLVLLVQRAAVIGHARGVAARDLQVGIGLIVAEQDVVARLEGLDQVVFQDQGLGLAVRDGGLQARDLRDHHRDARARQILLEVARHAVLQVARLADVEDLVLGVEIAVHARQAGQLGDRRQHLFAGLRARLAAAASLVIVALSSSFIACQASGRARGAPSGWPSALARFCAARARLVGSARPGPASPRRRRPRRRRALRALHGCFRAGFGSRRHIRLLIDRTSLVT
jgi:hypothetical protein